MSARIRQGLVLAAVLVAFFSGLMLRNAPAPSLTPDAGAAAQKAAAQATAQYGQMQAGLHGAGLTKPQIVPFIRTLKLRDHGDGTVQLQQALVRAKFRPFKAKATGYYGAITAKQVLAFQRKVKIRPSGVFGHPTLLKLSRFYTAAMRGKLQAIAKAHATAAYIAGLQRGVTAYARAAIAGRAHYSEGPSRGFLPGLPQTPLATDCSGYVTWLYMVAGLPDPSGFAYRVIGYTGTLAQHGVRVANWAKLRVGDLVFYGGGYPYGHVAMVVNPFLRTVTSHGQPGVRQVPFNYRVVSVIRRYF